MLDEMASEAESVIAAARGLSDNDGRQVADAVEEQRQLYVREANQIREIQASSTEVFLIHEYRAWTRMVFDRYQRNFAGHPRSTRDAGILVEMIADLESLDDELGRLEGRADDGGICASTRKRIDSNLELYRQERQHIVRARMAGSLEEQADMLASAANVQFAQYAAHYAGKMRLSRSIGRLERIVTELEAMSERMTALDAQGFSHESNSKNIETVNERVAFYRTEIDAVKAARANTSFEALVAELGRAANEIFDEYRKEYAGQPRETRELAPLALLTEGLYDLARQMNQLDRVRDDDNNQHNIAVVLDHLRMYHREYVEIEKLKKRS